MNTKNNGDGIYAVRNYTTSSNRPFQWVFLLPEAGRMPYGLERQAQDLWHSRDRGTFVDGFEMTKQPIELAGKTPENVNVYDETFSVWCFGADEVRDGKHVKTQAA